MANEPWSMLDYGTVCTVACSETKLAYYLFPVDVEIEERQMDYYGAWTGWNWIKVIGNIHENKELLEAK